MDATVKFGDWYRAKFGSRPVLVQGVIWFLYGFIWIPLWYINTRDHSASSVPSGIDSETLELELAPPWRRLVGYLIDITLGVGLGVGFVASGALSASEQREVGPVFVLVTPFYTTMLLEGIFGRSAGKLLTRTKVIDLSGRKPGWGRSFVRMLIRMIPFDWLSLSKGLMWHDTFSGTRVVPANVALQRSAQI